MRTAKAVEAKLWTIDDLKTWLGYDDTASALEAMKALKIPHLVVGNGSGKLGSRGVARRLRFVPAALEAWAISSQVVHEDKPVPEPFDEPTAIIVPVSSGWRAAMGLPAKGRR